jgi:hypothetical protein
VADDIDPDALGDLVLQQLAQQGCGCVRVSDGQVFVFSRAFLEALLTRALESGEGMVMVHVKRGPEA